MRLLARILAASLSLLPLPAAAQNSEAGLAAMRSRLASEGSYAGVFGVAYGPSRSIDALGDVRSGQPHETQEAFRWASVSKMITAILIFQQVDEGHIALDAPVKTYLPDASIPNADRITIRHLLAHRSGLAGQADTPNGPPGDLLQYCQATAADPGSTFLYNNCDTIVLGKILEAVVGEPYLTQVNQRIGTPLGFAVTLPDEPRVEATMEDGSAEQPAWPSAYGPAGGLYGTAEDLLKVDVALIEGRLISATSLATMLTGDPASGYATLSVWSYSPDLKGCIGNTRLVERYGEIGGVQVRNFLLPDLGVALVVYSNDHRTNFGEVWRGQGLSIDLIRAAACGAPD